MKNTAMLAGKLLTKYRHCVYPAPLLWRVHRRYSPAMGPEILSAGPDLIAIGPVLRGPIACRAF